MLVPVRALVLLGSLLTGCASTDRPSDELRGGERLVIFEVAPRTQACMRMTLGACLYVRERPGGTWRTLPEGIDGFDFEPGHAYVVETAHREIADPPADGYDRAYRLLRVVEKTAE